MVHQFPFYPGTGSLKELGYKDGLGYTLNVPHPAMLGDEDYLRRIYLNTGISSHHILFYIALSLIVSPLKQKYFLELTLP